MSRPAHHLHLVDDEHDPEYDPTGYYARKTAHREEMLPNLAAIFVAAVACVVVAYVWQLVT